jgi:octanoyl-[GcvH]:protein N-octanoyltransferase
MRLLRGPLVNGEPALDLALARAMVNTARLGQVNEALRIYRPTAPVVVFGRRDTRLAGFPAAVRAARAAGFEPVVRATGGRAVAYTSAALVLDHVRHEPGSVGGQDIRFAEFGRRFVDVFRELGIDARLGAVPGEYCPGAHSVNARGLEKLVGTAQRMVPGAWLFSSLVVVGDEDRLRPLLGEVYRCLGQDFDERSVGSLSREVPGLDADVVEAAILGTYLVDGPVRPAEVDADLLDAARGLVVHHRV